MGVFIHELLINLNCKELSFFWNCFIYIKFPIQWKILLLRKSMEVPIRKAIKTMLSEYQYNQMIDFWRFRYKKTICSGKMYFPFMIHSTSNMHVQFSIDSRNSVVVHIKPASKLEIYFLRNKKKFVTVVTLPNYNCKFKAKYLTYQFWAYWHTIRILRQLITRHQK